MNLSDANSGGYATNQPLVKDIDYTVIGKGFRNPFRSFVTPDDILWVTDVGSGDDPFTERIYRYTIINMMVYRLLITAIGCETVRMMLHSHAMEYLHRYKANHL